MASFPPPRIEDAKAFSCCSAYKNWQLCIYVGGGSQQQHNMHWGYIIYTAAGDRYHYGYLPASCLDLEDGEAYCRAIIDRWEQPLGYEEIRLWRDIVEFLASLSGSTYEPIDPDYIAQKVEGCYYLISPDRTCRQKLWDLYKIQLIKWQEGRRRRDEGGWVLKGNWEDKIWFLEQVYVLDRNPDTLPRPWLDKWERKQKAEEDRQWWQGVSRLFDHLSNEFRWTEEYLPQGERKPVYSLESSFFRDRLGRILAGIKSNSAELRSLLPEISNRLKGRPP
jgi:hypothetical protein